MYLNVQLLFDSPAKSKLTLSTSPFFGSLSPDYIVRILEQLQTIAGCNTEMHGLGTPRDHTSGRRLGHWYLAKRSSWLKDLGYNNWEQDFGRPKDVQDHVACVDHGSPISNVNMIFA